MQHWRGYRLRMISTMVAVPDISTEAVPGGNETVPMRLGVVARCNSLPATSSIDTANPGVSSDFINMVQPVEPVGTSIVIVPLSAYAVAALRSKACIACRVSPPWGCTSNSRLAGVGMFTLKERMESNADFDTPLHVPFITHWLHNMSHDQVLDMLKYLNMSNAEDTKVKVIFVPCYLDGRDGIVNMPYYDLLIGFDLTVYASYYEPWGYTPLESVAFHVPTITTDLSGFGLWVNSVEGHYGMLEDGVKVIHRTDYNYSEVADAIKDTVSEFSSLDGKDVLAIRQKAENIAEKALWKHFIRYYYEAYDFALRNRTERLARKDN